MPGPLPGQTVTAGTIFGLSKYGTSLYGLGLPPEYLVEPMAAASDSYTSVLVTWHPPSGIIFRYRLIRNRFGFPVNENDGDIIYDTTTYPGNSYTDLDISPGTYHYYGFYVLVDIADNIWIRSGFAGCLAVQDYGSGQYLFDLLPEYFTTIPATGAALTDDAAGNSQLQLFLNVFGWALDYLRTQYATYANHLNDARFIPLDQLWDLAQQVGLTFSPDVPAYTVRKATENFAHVAGQRGTLAGIAEEIALRTGYGADVHMGPNILLDDDQAQILSPVFLQYQATRCYAKDECIWVPYLGRRYWWQHNGDGWWFRSLQNSNCGNTPPAGGSSNSFWEALYDSDDFLGTQANIVTSNPGTWEILDTGATNYLPLPNSATQGLGVLAPPPVNSGSNAFAWNALRFYNRQGTSRTLWCRSISRRSSDLGQIPDPSFELGTTIAPPDQLSNRRWVPRSWPAVEIPNWMGGTEPVHVPAYWTPVNALFTREESVVHTGSWALQITPSGGAVAVPAATAPQYANPGFESAAIPGWSSASCTISQSSAQAHGGGFSLYVVPAGTMAGSTFTASGNPSVTGPQIAAQAGLTDTVSVYMYGTKTEDSAAFPFIIPAIQYSDISGNVLQTTESSSVQLSAGWTQLTATATAPANTAFKTLIAISDPAHTADINPWYMDDIAWSWNAAAPAQASLALNSPWITCPAGTACTASLFYQAASGGSTATGELVFYDAAGNTLATDAGTPVTGTANSWVNPTASATAPAGTQYAALNLLITGAVPVSYLDDTTITAGLTYSNQPDQIQAVRDGIPVPWVLDGQEWDPAVRYVTNDIVHYDGQPFTALRASTGSVPPGNNTATTDWAPLSQSRRIRLCLSGYTSQNLTNPSNLTYAVTPFIEWYDAQGNFITRVLARSAAGNGSVSQPNNMAYDSFTTESVIASAGAGSTTASPGPWNAAFWNNTALSGTPVLTRVDPAVNFTWNGTAPAAGIALSGWSASWITTYTAPAAGNYGFQLQAGQGGSRLIINGQTVIDNWAAQSGANLTAATTLTAGQVITIEADYWNPPAAQSSYQQDIISLGTITVEALYERGQVPNSWVLFDHISYTSSPVALTPGEQLTVTGNAAIAQEASGVLTVTWLSGSGQVTGTSAVSFGLAVDHVIDSTFTAPDGTVAATVSFSVEGTPLIYQSSGPPFVEAIITGTQLAVQALQAAANPDSLVFGTVSVPAIPSSATQFSSSLAGRATDDEQSSWTVPAGAWTVGGYAGGSAWPAAPGTQSIGLLTTQPANTSLGVTYRSMPQGGAWAGIVFRYSGAANYWRSDQNQLGYVQSGVYTLVAAHSQPFRAGDRMTITLNGSSVTVYRNGTRVNSATNSFNSTAAEHGIINDITGATEAAASDPLRKNVGPARGRRRMPPQHGGRAGRPGRGGRP